MRCAAHASSHLRRIPRSADADSIVLAVAVALVLCSTVLGPGVALAVRSTEAAAPAAVVRSPAGDTLLTQAEASLAAGRGPAGGILTQCTGGGESATCSATPNTSEDPTSGATPNAPAAPRFLTPSPRFGAPWTNVVVGSSSYLLMFGGANSSGSVFGETWALSTAGTGSWTNLTNSSCTNWGNPCPAPRHDAMIAWDAADEYVVLFGGCGAPTQGWIQSTPGCPSGYIYGDTWIWTPSTVGVAGNWTQVHINGILCGGPGQPTCSTSYSPVARYASTMDYDLNLGKVVLFGGCGSSTCPLGDTWSFVAGSWVKLAVSHSPPARYGASMVFDLPDFYTVLFGGCGTSTVGCTSANLYGDTWTLGSSTWTQAGSCGGPSQPSCGSGSAPSDRYFALMSCFLTPQYVHGLRDYVALTGGTAGAVSTKVFEDYWVFGHGSWSKVSVPWGFNPFPSPRFDGDLIDENLTYDQFSMFGGTSPSGTSLGDTEIQSYPARHFETVWPLLSPTPRASFNIAAESGGAAVVLFGGCGHVCPLSETWIYGECQGTGFSGIIPMQNCTPIATGYNDWWNVTGYGTSPPAREFASMATDPSGTVVLFGGVAAAGSLLRDTWTFLGPTLGWSSIPCGASCPSARTNASMTEIGPSSTGQPNEVILFGGVGAGGALQSDTWSYAMGIWTQHTLSQHPGAREGASFAFDYASTDWYAVLFGGSSSTSLLQQTWELVESSTPSLSWSSLTPPSCTSSTCPPASSNDGLSYDFGDQYLLLFADGNLGTWSFHGGIWTQVTSSPACVPSCAFPLEGTPIASLQSTGSNVVLFGGWGFNGSIQGQTFEYGSGIWVLYGSKYPAPNPTSPPPLAGAVLISDPSVGAVILVGGCSQFTDCAGIMQGMWAFQSGSWKFLPFSTGVVGAPERVAYAAATYAGQSPSGYVELFGGLDTRSWTLSDETWILTGTSISTLSWTQLAVGGPVARWGASMAYDATDGYSVLFGGCGVAPAPGSFGSCTSLRADSWALSSTSWSQIAGAGPGARFGAAMSGGAQNGQVYLVGGEGSTAPFGDEWEFVHGAWSLLVATLPFTARYGAGLTYDSLDSALVLSGGFSPVPHGATLADADTWVSLAPGQWLNVTSTGSQIQGRGWDSLAFNPSAGGAGWVQGYGGSELAASAPFGQTLYFTQGSGWVDVSNWA